MQCVAHLNQCLQLIRTLIQYNKVCGMSQKGVSKIEWFSQQIEIDPLNKSFIIERSDAFVVEGRYDQAISDCSKLILLEPSREYYVKRSRLLQDRGMFLLAIQDLAEARTLVKAHLEETAEDIYLESSVCMTYLKEASEMAHLVEEVHEKEDASKYSKTLEELLYIRQIKLQKLENERQQEIRKLKQFYEEQTNSLKQLFLGQLGELKTKLQFTVQSYQQRFQTQLLGFGLNPSDKQKMKLYFETFSSEMQKYYIAAKNLHKIEDKSIKFQDFQQIITNKNRNDFMKKIYKFFDKYSSQIEKIVSIIQNIPYIGCAFTVIKASMRTKGWIEEVNIEAQCHNIERVAINTTSFNEFSTNLAYYITLHYEKQILAHHPKYKSEWEQLLLRIKELKRENLGVNHYKHHLSEEMEAIKDYATIHASIIMVAYACNSISLSRDNLKELNRNYEKGDKKADVQQLSQIYRLLSEVQSNLRIPLAQAETPQKEVQKHEKGYCEVY